MRIFLDQMFRADLAEALRRLGHDVRRAEECGLARADDAEILQQAIKETRVLITLDGHFGNWAVLPLKAHPGVIRVRTHPTTTENVLGLLRPFLAQADPARCENQLVILSLARIRGIRTGE